MPLPGRKQLIIDLPEEGWLRIKNDAAAQGISVAQMILAPLYKPEELGMLRFSRANGNSKRKNPENIPKKRKKIVAYL